MIDGLRWEVRSRGTGAPLLLLHGFTGRGASWSAHADRWVRAGRRVIVVDLPGHGRTRTADAARASIERTADDLAAILGHELAGPADVLGYSLGARVALRLAAGHPAIVGRLVLESPSAGIADAAARAARRAADEALATRIERDGIEAFVTEWERNPVFASHAAMAPARLARQRGIRMGNRPDGLAASLRGGGQGAMEPLHDQLAGITTPTLVLTGGDDAIGRPRAAQVAAAIPGARLAIVEGAGHTPHDEQPRTFHRLVDDFLQEDRAA
ncbi:MAG: alpha/beta fold hydrolase [Chloroflexota bacterium]